VHSFCLLEFKFKVWIPFELNPFSTTPKPKYLNLYPIYPTLSSPTSQPAQPSSSSRPPRSLQPACQRASAQPAGPASRASPPCRSPRRSQWQLGPSCHPYPASSPSRTHPRDRLRRRLGVRPRHTWRRSPHAKGLLPGYLSRPPPPRVPYPSCRRCPCLPREPPKTLAAATVDSSPPLPLR
jgi:hypothetical protein